MHEFKFNEKKALNAVLYILDKIGDSDFHKIFKTLYFADKKHISQYGRPIMGDSYIAMQNGPVPSRIYDILKYLREGDSILKNSEKYKRYFEVYDNHYVKGKRKSDDEYLSESEASCLNEAIEENKDLNFNALKRKSHDNAYDSADNNDEISYKEIVEDSTSNEHMIDYVKGKIENNTTLL